MRHDAQPGTAVSQDGTNCVRNSHFELVSFLQKLPNYLMPYHLRFLTFLACLLIRVPLCN